MTALWHRVRYSLRQQGVVASFVKLVGALFERGFDRKYGTDTSTQSNLDSLTITGDNRSHATMRYEPTRVLSLRKLLPMVRSLVPPRSALVDLGCGKGRVLLLAAQAGFATVRGVEFAAELSETARQNCTRFKAATGFETTFEIIHADVTQYRIRPDESVFFLFNPFDVVLFDRVLSAIIRSWQNAPRAILIVILLPTREYRDAIARRTEITFARRVRSWGYDFCLYTLGEMKPLGGSSQSEH